MSTELDKITWVKPKSGEIDIDVLLEGFRARGERGYRCSTYALEFDDRTFGKIKEILETMSRHAKKETNKFGKDLAFYGLPGHKNFYLFCFYPQGMTQENAINRFAAVVGSAYDELKEKGVKIDPPGLIAFQEL